MPLQKIQFAPGISKEGTDYTADQGWTDSDKIRFRKGRPEKIGGWEKFSTNTYEGVGKSLYTWSSLGATKHTEAQRLQLLMFRMALLLMIL